MGPGAVEALVESAQEHRALGHEALAQEIQLLAQRAGGQSARLTLGRILSTLYARHVDALLAQRWPRFTRDAQDQSAQQFLCGAPFQTLWPKVTALGREAQLRYLLLLRLKVCFTRTMEEKLVAFKASEVLSAAKATYWPIEIEPLAFDGAYGWTTRAGKVEGNVVTDLMRLSVKMPDYRPAEERGEWVHCKVWAKWTYVVRLRQTFLKDAIVVSESVAWAGNSNAPLSFSIYTRCETVRGIPQGVCIPTATISGKEEIDWHARIVYEWARPYIPKQYQKRLRFSPNRFAPPEVSAPTSQSVAAAPREYRDTPPGIPIRVTLPRASTPATQPIAAEPKK